MEHTKALLTGSMNPFTMGHKHVVDMGLLVFDTVIVGIGHNPEKDESQELFSRDQRIRMAKECVAEYGIELLLNFSPGLQWILPRHLK